MESTETISPFSISARDRAIADFPTAVGPARSRGRRAEDGRRRAEDGGRRADLGFPTSDFRPLASDLRTPSSGVMSASLGLRARKPAPEGDAGSKDGDTEQVCGGQAAVDMRFGVVSAKIFNERSSDRVREQVCGEDLAVEFLSAIKPGQAQVKGEVQDRVVDFGRVHRVGGRVERVIRWKSDRPRQVACPAVAAAVQKTADSTEYISQGDAGRDDVRQPPHWKVFDAGEQNSGQGGADQTAVVDEASALHHENFCP